MVNLPRDPWQTVKTYHGLKADLVISALQKEIRRGHGENAALLAYEMAITSPALEDYLWQRLMIISVEDIGFGAPQAPVLINALVQMIARLDRGVAERKLFAVHAVRYLCGCRKDRSSDEMINYFMYATEHEGLRPVIPDYAVDMHTADGQALGRGRAHFWNEGAQIDPAWEERDKQYHDRLSALLAAGKWD